ncbi:MAG TPA: peptidylprolyl isomerase [Thermoleophilaceae bacterium]|nr:peptidylprolyl isomerase [Thermoleophilaceae bacterium]
MYRSSSVVVVVAVLALAGCGGDDEESEPRAQQAETVPAEQAPGCKEVPQPEPRDGGGQKNPKPLDPAKTYEVVLQTSCGDFTIRLDQKTSPQAAASFAALSRDGFFDDTIFHRIVPDFVIQGGDPTVSGSGGPGYSTRDEVPGDAAYEPGVVAMAKAGNEPPGTGGSQFFVVTGSSTGLTPDYALLGKVTDGMDVVQAIGELGDPASGGAGTPLQSVVIEKATVREL